MDMGRKIDERGFQRLVQTMEKTLCKTSEDLKADLEQTGIIISSYTIWHTLNQAGFYG